MKKTIASLALVSLAACAVPVTPVVTSFNGDSVEVQVANLLFADEATRADGRAAAEKTAADICQRGPNKRAEYVSTRTVVGSSGYADTDLHLFLCLN